MVLIKLLTRNKTKFINIKTFIQKSSVPHENCKQGRESIKDEPVKHYRYGFFIAQMPLSGN